MNGHASKEEAKFLETYYDAFDIKDDLISSDNEEEFLELKISIRNKIDNQINAPKVSMYRYPFANWRNYAAAAILIVSTSFFGYLLLQQKKVNNSIVQQILPGGFKAVLTLSNGKKILLDNTRNGRIASQASESITKTSDNKIVYESGSVKTKFRGQQLASDLKNTISTPNGGQYQIVLPDGTKVKLNAASSLTYPACFAGHERLVLLEGEAYFEVSKNKAMPFLVKSGGQTVRVLGTHFDINAYSDESIIKTTLLEGSVKVYAGNSFTQIEPGQQAAVSREGQGGIKKYDVDVNAEIAWTNGLFSFKGDDLHTIMRQIGRWYNVKIAYADKVTDKKFVGEISRTSKLSDVLKILELSGSQFQVKGTTVIVSSPKY